MGETAQGQFIMLNHSPGTLPENAESFGEISFILLAKHILSVVFPWEWTPSAVCDLALCSKVLLAGRDLQSCKARQVCVSYLQWKDTILILAPSFF